MKTLGDLLDGFETLPRTDILALLNGRRALILAPHPDDESLGCGGLIAAACAAGLQPAVIIMTDGAASHPGSSEFPPARLRSLREAEAMRALQILCLPETNVLCLRQDDTRLTASAETIDRAKAFGQQFGCEMVIGPWGGDPHCDHEATAAIADAIAQQTGWDLLSYPIWGWMRNRSDRFDEPRSGGWRLDITAHLQRKARAIAAHRSQYGGLIQDSPTGFRLPENLLEIFARPFEVYIA